MATSYYEITEGSGTKIRTHQRVDSGDTVEEAMVAETEPILATYAICPTAALSTATANSHLLQIMAGASLRVGIRRIIVTQMVASGAATAGQYELRRLTTAGTGGTSITPNPVDPADSASGATAMTLPSSKGTEDVLLDIRAGQLLATVAVAGRGDVLTYDFTRSRTKCLWIAAGTSNGIALKNVTAIASGTVHITAEIVEASWA